ncbi:uncharacterized protein LOC135839221 isoform X2 [Planococcus citri]
MQQPNLFHSIKSQFHAQDEYGQYSYGYNDGLSSKVESKTADGITHGSYSYVDSNGIVQKVNYVSDDVNGFRVSGSNIPAQPSYQYDEDEDQNEVIVEPSEINIAVPLAMSSSDLEPVVTPVKKNATEQTVSIEQSAKSVSLLSKTGPTISTLVPTYTYDQSSYNPYSLHTNELGAISVGSLGFYNVPALSPVYGQFHSQDELGQYSYGYFGGPSSKVETKTSDGITRGGYSYVDANGILQRVNYISDPINGFRVHTTNFPVTNFAQSTYYPSEYQLPKFNLLSNQKTEG